MGQFLQIHESPDIFRQALSFTAGETGFRQPLIEKDYYCSLILATFEPLFAGGLVFKGGTSLSKVHAGFYRLSEDLDFAISIETTAGRAARRKAIVPIRQHLEQITKQMNAINTSEPLTGHDGNRQYNAVLQYKSAVTGENETVKVQVAVREPIIESTISCAGRTLLRQPVPEETPDEELSLCVLSLHETYAEKVRAALTRDPPAIRDIFDIDYAVRAERLDLFEPKFLKLVQQKLAVPRNAAIDTSHVRRKTLESQLETDLRPVLRSSDYETFDIDRAFAEVEKLAVMVHGN